MTDIAGVDIGSYAIKVASGKVKEKTVELDVVASAYNPVGQFLPVDPGQFQKLALVMKQLFSEHKLAGRPVYVGLPESFVYTSVITLPYLSDAELASSIHWEAEQHIPVPLSEVNLEYEVLSKPKKGAVGEHMRVLLVAAKKEVVARLVELFHLAGLEIVGLETVLLAVYRSVASGLPQSGASMICHMGALTTDLLIVDGGSIVLTYTIQTGGLAFTRAIEKGLGLPPSQAEEYKRAYGLDEAQLEGRVRGVLMPILQLMTAEIRKAVQYYQTAHAGAVIRTILLSGGSAYLPALSGYMAQTFAGEVALANPMMGVSVKEGVRVPAATAVFAGAVGLALHKDEE